jgi:hypothetical protein
MLSIANKSLLSNNSLSDELFCPALFDNLCWPQTHANHSVTISCSPLMMQGVDSTSYYFAKYFLENLLFNFYRISHTTVSSVGKMVKYFI